jgi:ADP-ribose pyrophosphatase YjhB (NUDIX family)
LVVSAGLALVDRNRPHPRLLLCHPTRAPWAATFSIPKGVVEPGEDLLTAALRETREETGIVVPAASVGEGGVVDYIDQRGRLNKRLHWFMADVTPLALPDILPKVQLQLAEVDWAGLLDRHSAEAKIFHRLRPLLELLERR